ncbi:hypothetical protein [Colwellia polaris]|mgnify:FL=1|uniref:hypothetical protein n=1 Tax=Colwellia polaris TaxID=326537 RepID=UPI000A175499|nr:hypothetical protein [Colwellia polaris]
MLSIPQLFGIWLILLASFITYKISTSAPSDIDRKYSKTSSFSHKETKEKEFPLVINTWPIYADIKIMNIKQKYERYMLLPEGEYIIEVSSQGYQKKKKVVKLNQHFYVRDITLKPKQGS